MTVPFVPFQLEQDAGDFSGKVMVMLEDRRRECDENTEDIKQLHERVKYNYDRLDGLTEIPLKVTWTNQKLIAASMNLE